MAKKRKAVKAKSKRRKPAQTAAGLADPFFRWVAPPAALILLTVVGLTYARRHVSRLPQFQVEQPELVLPENLPDHWRLKLTQEISRYAQVEGRSVLESTLSADLTRQYERSPWVREVAWVRTEFPNRIRAGIRVRYPAAVVVYDIGGTEVYYVVGDDGVRLPGVYRGTPPRTMNLPAIRGIRKSPPRPGRAWSTEAVAHSVDILRHLRASEVIRGTLRIRAIDASNYGGREAARSEFTVICDRNCDIEWGRAPGTQSVGELPPEEKIAKLERHIIRGYPIENRVLNVRFPGRIVVSRKREWHGHDG